MKRIVTPKYVEHVTMNIYVKDSQISADLSTLSATGKAQKGKKFFVDLLMDGGPRCAGLNYGQKKWNFRAFGVQESHCKSICSRTDEF